MFPGVMLMPVSIAEVFVLLLRSSLPSRIGFLLGGGFFLVISFF